MFGGFIKNRLSKVNKTNTKIDLLDNVRGRSITEKVIPTVCNIKVMLNHLKENEWKIDNCRPWEKRSYKAYRLDIIQHKLMSIDEKDWIEIIRNHILTLERDEIGASCVDIYIVGYVSEKYGVGLDSIFNFVKNNEISEKINSAKAIYTVDRGDGIYLNILNKDGTIKDWDFINRWVHVS